MEIPEHFYENYDFKFQKALPTEVISSKLDLIKEMDSDISPQCAPKGCVYTPQRNLVTLGCVLGTSGTPLDAERRRKASERPLRHFGGHSTHTYNTSIMATTAGMDELRGSSYSAVLHPHNLHDYEHPNTTYTYNTTWHYDPS